MYKQDDVVDNILRILCGCVGAFLLFILSGKLFLRMFGIEYAHSHPDDFIFMALLSIWAGWSFGYRLMEAIEKKNKREMELLEKWLNRTSDDRDTPHSR